MNRFQIKKQLKKEADANTPDPYDKIIYAAESQGLFDGFQTGAVSGVKSATAVKRPLIYIVSLALALIICLAVVLPVVLNGSSPADIPLGPTSLTVDDVYGLGAVTTVRLLDGHTSGIAATAANVDASASVSGQRVGARAVNAAATTADADATVSDDEVKDQAEKFNEYFTALDCFLGDDVITTVAETNSDPDYPYEIKLTITGKDVEGNDEIYVMYYTETLIKSENKHDETERVYHLEGIMIVDGVSHRLVGEREFEQERDETENELKIRAYANVEDKSSYVEMKQENSVEDDETETEYVYSVYTDGKLVEQTAVKFETERKGDKQETEYELEFRQGDAKGKYKVEREIKNGVVQMKVSYDLDGKKGEFTVRRAAEDKYEYLFSDGTIKFF